MDEKAVEGAEQDQHPHAGGGDQETLRGEDADSEYLEALVKSMPRRMVDVIERDGGMTKY